MAKKKSAKPKAKPQPRMWIRTSDDPLPAAPKTKVRSKPLLSNVVSRATSDEDLDLPEGDSGIEKIHELAFRFRDLLEEGVELLGADNAAKFFIAATAEAFGGAEGLVDSLVQGIPEPTSQVFRLKITILDSSPLIERIIDIPDCNLGYLHEVIQDAFGWTNSHLHLFEDGKKQFGPLFEDDGMPSEWDDECNTLLSDILDNPKTKKLKYTYDFGDSWRHQIEFVSKEPVEKRPASAVCVSGKSAGPPEDCGGVFGYGDILQRLRKKKLTEEDFIDPDFDPTFFNLKEINDQLKQLKWKEFH